MLDLLVQAIATDGFWFLCFGAFVAGLVRGFAGFGTAMIFLPVAGQVLGPFEALTTLLIIDLTAPLIHVPRALRDGHPADVVRLGLGAAIAVPFGVWALTLVAPEVFRWGVSGVALCVLICLITGIRYRGELTKGLIFVTGLIGGFLGGSVGIPGAPVILLYMASTLPPKAVRANNTLYLILADVLLLIVLAWRGLLASSALVIGVLAILPYLIGNWLGALLFQPGKETLYRRIAYVIIGASAVSGLPLWD
ncbi:MAG: sulfite exporter TauE/SafE family protein [Pseudomonadota bacterium]